MTTRTASRRGQRRYPIVQGRGTSVEFDHPAGGGRRCRLPLLDLSVSGVSFHVNSQERAVLETGTALPGTVLHLAHCTIEGELVVMHVTQDSESSATCGALFYPLTDADLLKLNSAIAGMEAIDTA